MRYTYPKLLESYPLIYLCSVLCTYFIYCPDYNERHGGLHFTHIKYNACIEPTCICIEQLPFSRSLASTCCGTVDVVMVICSLLLRDTDLTHLDLSFTQLTEDGLNLVVESLSHNTNLTSLWWVLILST